MRVVIDTNSLVAALTRPGGSSGRLLDLWRSGAFDLVASDATLSEMRLVLGGRWLTRVAGPGAAAALVAEIETGSVIVEAPVLPDLKLKDQGDRRLVEAAQAGNADYLVTADREVLLTRGYGATQFLTAGEALSRIPAL